MHSAMVAATLHSELMLALAEADVHVFTADLAQLGREQSTSIGVV